MSRCLRKTASVVVALALVAGVTATPTPADDGLVVFPMIPASEL